MALPSLLSNDDLLKFRTRFCERFLQFGECNFGGKCQYSHNMTWRRRSPQKYLYEPRMCENVISFLGDNGRRQTTMNCHNGKSCKCAHSREEVLYHPVLYKTIMCDEFPNCNRYYCPFGHSVDELLPTAECEEYIRECYRDVEVVEDDSDQLEEDDSGSYFIAPNEDSHLRMRKASANNIVPRVCLPNDWNLDPSAWITIAPSLRIETVPRAHSPAIPSELCRAMVARNEFAPPGSSAAKKTLSSSQMCLAKVIQTQLPLETIVAQLTVLAKTDHRNIISIKRVYVDESSSEGRMLVLAFDQCTTSLHQAITDGYTHGGLVRGLAKKLNAHNGQTSPTAVQRIAEILAGVQRLHFAGIAHLRLCPTNILVDSESCFKIGDFLGKLGVLSSERTRQELAAWQAPELTAAGDPNLENLFKCDVYSIGCLVFYALTGQHLAGNEENIAADYFANQHLLYNCPLVLDLVLRCCAFEPSDRPEVADVARHPLFWDLDFTKSFMSTLPWGEAIFEEFMNYELCWDKQQTGGTVAGLCKHLIANSNSPGTWLRLLAQFPQVLIRAWDGTKLAKMHGDSPIPLFKRNHLHWMTLRASATTWVSHGFVREYYAAVAAVVAGRALPETALDESKGLSEAAVLTQTCLPPPAVMKPRRMSPMTCPTTPIVSASFGTTLTPGMTFVDPLIVKQMAAASAALSAVFENPELVRAIAPDCRDPQLVAAATIYASLLEKDDPAIW